MSAPEDLPDVPAPGSEVEPQERSAPPKREQQEREPERLPERRPEAGGVAAVEPPTATPHAARFQVFSGVLIAVALAAVAAVFLVASAGSGPSAGDRPSWAAFRPSSDGLDTGASEIAAYVGGRYRMPNGQQIVAVTGGPMEIQGMPMRIAVRHSAADGGQIDVLDGRGVLYRLCGLGPKCAIPRGTSTPERLLLLQREALELALYSFHDLKDVDNVVVFMPPKKGKSPDLALHFQRGQVAGQLTRPLRATLPALVPTPDTIDRAPEKPFVETLTFGNIFKVSLTPANQDTSVFLVLDPVPAQS